jgi:hypothetical protein
LPIRKAHDQVSTWFEQGIAPGQQLGRVGQVLKNMLQANAVKAARWIAIAREVAASHVHSTALKPLQVAAIHIDVIAM